MTFQILPYKQGSKSAKALDNVLDCKVLKLKGSKYKPKPDDTIINCGSTTLPEWTLHKSNVLNRYNISDVSNKFKFFQMMSGEEYLPKFWTKKEDIPDEAFPIVCRTVLSGHSGVGIVIADNRDDLVPANLRSEERRVGREFVSTCRSR